MGLRIFNLHHFIRICIIFYSNDADFPIMMQITLRKSVTLQRTNKFSYAYI